MFAQGLVEYGGLSTLKSGVEVWQDAVQFWLRSVPTSLWLLIAGAVLLFLLVYRRI